MVGIFLLVSVSMAPLQGPDEKINRQKWDVAIAAMKPRQEKFTSAKFLRKEEKQEYFNLIEGGDEPVWITSNTTKSNKIIDCFLFTAEKIVNKSKNAPENYGIIINDNHHFSAPFLRSWSSSRLHFRRLSRGRACREYTRS